MRKRTSPSAPAAAARLNAARLTATSLTVARQTAARLNAARRMRRRCAKRRGKCTAKPFQKKGAGICPRKAKSRTARTIKCAPCGFCPPCGGLPCPACAGNGQNGCSARMPRPSIKSRRPRFLLLRPRPLRRRPNRRSRQNSRSRRPSPRCCPHLRRNRLPPRPRSRP